LGEVYLQQKNFPQALENYKKALTLAESQQRPAVMRSASLRLGDILYQTGRPAEAVPHFERAVQQIESTRSLLESQEYRQSYFEGGLDAYVRMVAALLTLGKPAEAFNHSERARSRLFLDILGSKVQLSRVKSGLLQEEGVLQERIAFLKAKLAGVRETEREGLRRELREAEEAYNAFLAKVRKQNREQASLMTVEPLILKEVQELLEPGTTLIEYFVTASETFVWIIEREKLQVVRVDLRKEKLADLVKTFRETIVAPEEKEKLTQVSISLYQLLVRKVLPYVSGKELIIVPHDVLHYLPFHALYSPEGKYLIEEYSVSYLSSASLLQFTTAKRKAKGDLSAVLAQAGLSAVAQAGRVLAFGNPDLGDPSMNLRFAELEAREVQRLYPQSTVLLKKEATEEKGKSLSPQHDIIHFATHAELREEDPLSSAILLAKEGKEDGRLEVREVFGMELNASLVVLSACETGLGKLSSGDELVGLTRAFIYAGTPSVMASLWKVEDSSTATLMGSFYKNLRTMSKVEALRQAQLELIRGHPYFWAPFILVGDGK
jgi:CHAT domain-containing protein